MKSLKYILVFILISVALISSAILSFEPLSEICNVEEGCDLVQNSIYAETFGIKNSVYGVFIFSALLIVIAAQILKPTEKRECLLKLTLLFGSVIAIYFLIIQTFVLNAYCKYCLVADFSVIFATITIFFLKKEIKINFV